MKRVWCFDLETLDIFTATFLDRDSDEIRQFVITKTKDERKELFHFLDNEVAGLIGYNSIFFDANIIEYMYRYPDCTVQDIKRYAAIITSEDNRKPDVPEWKLRHKHLDLFRALSLSVKAKRTGLKWCEYQLDFDNIEDLPSDGEGNTWEEQVLSYNLNDCKILKVLYEKYKYDIELRKKLTKLENVNLLNSTEPDIAKKLLAKWLSQKMGISEFDLRSKGTDRKQVNIREIIFPYVHFETEFFNNVLQRFQSLVLTNNESFDLNVSYQNIEISYGLGGIHAAPNNVIVESNDEYIIKSLDATSYYPHLAFKNNLSPEHIPAETFIPLYEGLFEKRKSIPKSDPQNYVYKIVLNSLYGLTNDKFSFLRDRAVTLAICINGQLLLSMLIEKITTQIPDAKLIMANTDGIEILLPKQYEQQYYSICAWWEELTRIPLEHVEYSKMIISNVNHYIAIYTNGETKLKGMYEYKDIPLHKNKSYSIIPYAVYQHFVNGIPVRETIRNHKNIFDFCAGVRAKTAEKKGRAVFELRYVKDGQIKTDKLSKTVRYYISNKGKYLYKRYEDGSSAHVEAPLNIGKVKKNWKVTYFNKAYFPTNFEDYDIDYTYYIYQAEKWVNQIENPNQLKMF